MNVYVMLEKCEWNAKHILKYVWIWNNINYAYFKTRKVFESKAFRVTFLTPWTKLDYSIHLKFLFLVNVESIWVFLIFIAIVVLVVVKLLLWWWCWVITYFPNMKKEISIFRSLRNVMNVYYDKRHSLLIAHQNFMQTC